MGAIAGGGERYRRYFQDISTLRRWGATDGSVTPLIAPKPKHIVFLQDVLLFVSTDAAQSITLRDTSGAPATVLLVPNSPGIGQKSYSFGDEGIALPVGEGLDVVLSAAGLAFVLQIVGYRRSDGVLLPSEL